MHNVVNLENVWCFNGVWCFGDAQCYSMVLNHIENLGCHLDFIVNKLKKTSSTKKLF